MMCNESDTERSKQRQNPDPFLVVYEVRFLVE